MCTVIKMTARTHTHTRQREEEEKISCVCVCVSFFLIFVYFFVFFFFLVRHTVCYLSWLSVYPFTTHCFFFRVSEFVYAPYAKPLSKFVEARRNAFAIIATKSGKWYTCDCVKRKLHAARIVGVLSCCSAARHRRCRLLHFFIFIFGFTFFCFFGEQFVKFQLLSKMNGRMSCDFLAANICPAHVYVCVCVSNNRELKFVPASNHHRMYFFFRTICLDKIFSPTMKFCLQFLCICAQRARHSKTINEKQKKIKNKKNGNILKEHNWASRQHPYTESKLFLLLMRNAFAVIWNVSNFWFN